MSETFDPGVCPFDLRTRDDSGLIATAYRAPALAWRLSADRDDVAQIAYEVELASDAGFSCSLVSSGRVEGTYCAASWSGPPLASRQVVWARVRVWTALGITAWSDPLRMEGALFDDGDWTARPISPIFNVDRIEPGPVPLLRRAFVLDGPIEQARLYLSALGIQRLWLNGRAVSADLLEPGWTEYGRRLLYATYDVADLLNEGENVLAAEVADGWWRGNLTWLMNRAVYGPTTALLAQLEIDLAGGGRLIIASDTQWRGATGAIREADLYNGAIVDVAGDPTGWRLPGFDDRAWSEVVELPLPAGLEPRAMPAVRAVATLPAVLTGIEAGFAADFGQNHSGRLRLSVASDETATLTLRHAEVLEPDGRLHTAALRQARATDIVAIPAGRSTVEPEFTVHGYRYAEIDAPIGVSIEHAESVVISSDVRAIGHFACSDERLNRLYSNIKWSQRGNFVALPTDCPQRDERLGWSGDIQVFAQTACANFDSRAFLTSWLADLAIAQRADGNVTSVVPNVIQGHPYEHGGVGWGDAATLVPWALYEAYGDKEVLERQLPSMRRWVDYGISRLDHDGVWSGDFHLGDWLDPGAPPDRPEEATTDSDFIASSYLSFSAAALARSAMVLDDDAMAARYSDLSVRVAEATWRRWSDAAVGTQTGCAMAIEFGIAPDHLRNDVGGRLAALVETNGGRIATGFLGTPLVLPALTRTGQVDAAYRLLLNEDAPGWLYQVKHGATTMWERWDAILPDGSIAKGAMAAEDAESMTSFNHYAYGSVGAWLYRSLAGIAPAEPGYAIIDFSPQPGGDLTFAEADIDTPFGRASIRWECAEAALVVAIVIPPGARGRFTAPWGWRGSGSEPRHFGSGSHRFTLRRFH